MTKTHEFVLGKTDSSTDFEGHILDVEYVISSVSDDVKVVDMWRYWDSNNHNHSSPDSHEEMRLSWLSEDFKEMMMEELRHIEWGDFDLDKYCEENPDFNEAMNGELMGPDGLPLNYPYNK